MEAKLPEITLGETICEKLKNIYFHDESWISCYKKVAYKFSELKKIAKRFYSDKSNIEVLREICKFSENDIKDIL
jgi:hypothetical protein